MKPSFNTLFRRRERENKRPEEVFAVAAIAFCLRYDKAFRESFIHDFCCIQLSSPLPKLDITADDHKWGDLVIRGNDGSFVCVLEFKIGSPVQPHQNPNRPDFKYGKEICNDSDCSPCLEKIYVLVTGDEAKEKIDRNMHHDVRCDWKSWADLWEAVKPLDKNDGIVKDLFDCFGNFNIAAFRERQLNDMKLTNSAFQALKVIQVLDAIHKKLKRRQLKIKDIDDQGDNQEHWHTGVYVGDEESEKLASWFGFFGDKQDRESGCCEIWFYDSSYNLMEICQKLRKHGIEFKKEKDGESDVVRVKCPLKSIKGNLEWFESVYKAAGAIK